MQNSKQNKFQYKFKLKSCRKDENLYIKPRKIIGKEEIMQWNNLNFDLIKRGGNGSEKVSKRIRRIAHFEPFMLHFTVTTLKIFEGTNSFFISFGNILT